MAKLLWILCCILTATYVTAQSLYLGQRVPSVSETSSSASGPSSPRITNRYSSQLVRNNNPYVVFKDEERTGADHYMTRRCSNALDRLATSVRYRWPGVRVRVTEAWDENLEHSANSLHYSGRAVDLTTSDRDQSKYGWLGRLAVDAGFDWVYYENSLHIHASCKQCSSFEFACGNGNCIPSSWECDRDNDCGDMSDERNCGGCRSDQFQCNNGYCIPDFWECDNFNDCSNGEDEHNCGGGGGPQVPESTGGSDGCFPPSSVVMTSSGPLKIKDLTVGTFVLAMNDKGQLVYSPVITFMDYDTETEAKYETITTEDGNTLTVTRAHLIYKNHHDNFNESTVPEDPVFVSTMKVEDHIFTVSTNISEEPSLLQPKKIIDIKWKKEQGMFAPLTLEGNIIVDNVLASCYAVVNDHNLAHMTFAPLRFLYNTMPSLLKEKQGTDLLSWYPKLLQKIGTMMLDESHFYPSTVKNIIRED